MFLIYKKKAFAKSKLTEKGELAPIKFHLRFHSSIYLAGLCFFGLLYLTLLFHILAKLPGSTRDQGYSLLDKKLFNLIKKSFSIFSKGGS